MIYVKNIITDSNNIGLRKVNDKPNGCDEINIEKDLLEDKLYQLIDQFNVRKISHRDFFFTLLNNVHHFYDGNRYCEVLHVSSFNYGL